MECIPIFLSRPVPFSQPVLFFHCTEPVQAACLSHLCVGLAGGNEAGPQAAAQRSVSEGMGSQFSVRPGMKWDYTCGRVVSSKRLQSQQMRHCPVCCPQFVGLRLLVEFSRGRKISPRDS